MMEKTSLAQHGELLKSLASVLYREATDQFGDSRWSTLSQDIRVPRSGVGAVSAEYVLVDGVRRPFETSPNAGSLVLDLVQSRANLPGPWFGCLITITSAGQCEVKYSYDPTCVDRLIDDGRAGKPF
jgi:hypothetical protein